MNIQTCKSIALLWLTILSPTVAVAQHFPSDKDLTKTIKARVEEGRAVGIVVGVREADGTTRIVSFGTAGPNAQPLDSSSVFEIGSISKVFTGILLAEMVAAGEVSLSDPVSEFLPDEVVMPKKDGREITLLELSTHHSGLPSVPDNMSPQDPTNPYADYTVEQMYEFISGYELQRDIGSTYEYSNLATGLLGHVLARAKSLSYEELLREQILDPLDMNMTGITLSVDMQKRMANGHDKTGKAVPLWDLPTLAGAGAIRSDVKDMLKFLSANIGPAESQLERSMQNSHVVRKQLNKKMAVGLNWHVLSVGNDKIVWHNGGTGGFHSFTGFDPAKGVGVVVLSNSAHDIDDIGLHLINSKIPLKPAKKKKPEVKVARNILTSYVGKYDFTPAFSIVVTLEDSTLFAQATGQGKLALFPESDTKFFLKVVDAQISFTKNDAGAVSGLILHQNGANQPARKTNDDKVK